MNISLKQSLQRIGEQPGSGTILRIPGGLHSSPDRLSSLLQATRDPQVGRWRKTSEESISNRDFTEECQGVTHDGLNWYFSSNKNPLIGSDKRGIYRLSNDFRELAFFGIDFTGHRHIGDIDFYNGQIYAAMEQPAAIFWVNDSFSRHGRSTLKASNGAEPSPQGNSLPWCAINPWNGWLYSSRFGDANRAAETEIYAYDPDLDFRHVSTLNISHGLKRIQGGCFSPNGHLLLASDHSHDIHCYSALNGIHRGSVGIQVDTSSGEEVEGITVQHDVQQAGTASQVHVVLLDNDISSGDDIFFKHYSVPDTSAL